MRGSVSLSVQYTWKEGTKKNILRLTLERGKALILKLPNAAAFNTVPLIVVTPNHKLFELQLHNLDWEPWRQKENLLPCADDPVSNFKGDSKDV